MRQSLVIARHELLLMRSEFVPVVLFFVMPIAILAFIQGAFDLFLRITQPGLDASGADIAAPGQATMFGFMSLATFGHFFLSEHGWGTWNRVRALGVRPARIMGSKMAVCYLQQLVLFAVVMGVGAVFFDLSVAGPVTALLAVELLVAAGIVGYGLVACALATTQAQYNAFAYLGALVMAGLGGALTPFETLPAWARHIAPLTPTYWAVQGFEAVILEGKGVSGIVVELAVLAMFAVVLLAVGSWLFDPDTRRSTWA